jgi:hypothetical protein
MAPLVEGTTCDGCNSVLFYFDMGQRLTRVIATEYHPRHVAHYDGISEFRCPFCGRREGRWSGRVLEDGEYEERWGGERAR